MVGQKLLDRFQAGRLVAAMAEAVGGRGGGKPELAQAGGPDVKGIAKALETIKGTIKAA
jgi:alanyl-tRNA synthetase